MLGPMGVLCVLCAGLGVLAFAAVPVLTAAVGVAGTEEAARALGSGVLRPLKWVGAVFAGVLVASAAGILLVRRAAAPDRAPRALTWDCGYARPTARMQYGESSLAQMIAGLFAWVLWPTRATPRALTARDLFPTPQGFRTEVPDVVLDRAVRPGLLTLTRWTLRLRLLQRGKVQVYMVYILLVVIVLLVLEVPASRRADPVDRPTPAPSSETEPP
jgi:hydrogenase-4 component B